MGCILGDVTHETLDAAAEVLPAEAIDAIERAATSAHRHEDLFSERAANIKQSAVRDVFDISMRPGLVSLAGGSPYLQSLPLERLGQTAAKIIAEQGMTALQYGGGQGTEELRTQICEVMAAEGILDAEPGERGDHRGLAVRPGRGHQGLLQPRRRGARGGPHLRGRPQHLRGLPGGGRHRADGRATASSRTCWRPRSPPCRPPARTSSSCTPSPASTTPPASPWPRSAGSRSSIYAATRIFWCWRTTPTACSASTASR